MSSALFEGPLILHIILVVADPFPFFEAVEKFSPKFDFLEFSLADIVDDLVC